jgi:hypothetical protein
MEKLMEVSMKMRLVRMTVDIPLGLHNKIAKYNTAKWILFSQREEWSISHWPLINVREHFSQIFFHHSLLMAFFRLTVSSCVTWTPPITCIDQSV